MRQIIQELLQEDVKNCIKWRKRIKLLHIIAGNKISIERKEKHLWLESSPWRRHVILVLWHTLMPVKQRQQNVFFSIQDRSEEHTSELQSRFDLVCRLLLEKKNK